MRILDEADRLLSAAEYQTRREQHLKVLVFEDAVVLGFVTEFDSMTELLDGWKAIEEGFLRRNATALRRDPVKAWNVYCIYLTVAPCSDEQKATLLEIEEDLTGTRKIARAGILSSAMLKRSLAPLLPLASADAGTAKIDLLLEQRLDESERSLLELLRRQEFEPSDILIWVGSPT